jgi:hypothetical protein
MTEFHSEGMPDEDDIDDSIPHPSPDEVGLWSIHDPGFLEELDRRSADDSPGIPWSELRRESF